MMRRHPYSNCSPFHSWIQSRTFWSLDWMTLSAQECLLGKQLSWSIICTHERVKVIGFSEYMFIATTHLSLHRASRWALTNRAGWGIYLQSVFQGSSWASLQCTKWQCLCQWFLHMQRSYENFFSNYLHRSSGGPFAHRTGWLLL